MPGRSDQFTGLEKMIVIVANSLPDAVRGKLKLWCIEPKPNVFVSGVKDQLARKVVDLVLKYCPPESGILIFLEIPESPFFQIFVKGNPCKNISSLSGFQLICEKKSQEVV